MSVEIPDIVKPLVSQRGLETLIKVKTFVEEECIPADKLYHAQIRNGDERWKSVPPVIEELKAKAKARGLWNLFCPRTIPRVPGSRTWSMGSCASKWADPILHRRQ